MLFPLYLRGTRQLERTYKEDSMLEETENVDLFLSEPFPSYTQMLRRKYLEFGGMQTSVHADT